MQKKQIKNWIIKRYVFQDCEKYLMLNGSFITPYEPAFKINEYFNAKTETYFVEISAPFNHSTTFLNRDTYERFVDSLGFKQKVFVKDFYSKNSDEERYSLFFDLPKKKKKKKLGGEKPPSWGCPRFHRTKPPPYINMTTLRFRRWKGEQIL